jgi:hypothetical protein
LRTRQRNGPLLHEPLVKPPEVRQSGGDEARGPKVWPPKARAPVPFATKPGLRPGGIELHDVATGDNAGVALASEALRPAEPEGSARVTVPTSDRIPLAGFIRELRQAYGVRVPYNRVWAAAMAGDIPTERVGSRLYGNRADTPLLARALGLAAEDGAPASPPPTPAAVPA